MSTKNIIYTSEVSGRSATVTGVEQVAVTSRVQSRRDALQKRILPGVLNILNRRLPDEVNSYDFKPAVGISAFKKQLAQHITREVMTTINTFVEDLHDLTGPHLQFFDARENPVRKKRAWEEDVTGRNVEEHHVTSSPQTEDKQMSPVSSYRGTTCGSTSTTTATPGSGGGQTQEDARPVALGARRESEDHFLKDLQPFTEQSVKRFLQGMLNLALARHLCDSQERCVEIAYQHLIRTVGSLAELRKAAESHSRELSNVIAVSVLSSILKPPPEHVLVRVSNEGSQSQNVPHSRSTVEAERGRRSKTMRGLQGSCLPFRLPKFRLSLTSLIYPKVQPASQSQ